MKVPPYWRTASLAVLALLLSLDGWAQTYPNARTGGNYMHNYLLPPAASSTLPLYCRTATSTSGSSSVADTVARHTPFSGGPIATLVMCARAWTRGR